MARNTDLAKNLKEDKASLNNAITDLSKKMADYKAERKSDWKSFKAKFNDDMNIIKDSLKRIKALHKN